MNEKELITRLKRNDEAAFRELVAVFQDKVFNTAIGMLQKSTDAEDIAQEVFIQVYKSIADFKENAALSTWIYRITVTKCLDHLRFNKRKKRLGFLVSLWGKDNEPIYEPEEWVHPGVQLDRKEAASAFLRLLNKLPEKQKTAIILNKLEGLSYAEVAVILETTESAVDSLLQRAKQSLKKLLDKE